jgi:hypothetical protein
MNVIVSIEWSRNYAKNRHPLFRIPLRVRMPAASAVHFIARRRAQ